MPSTVPERAQAFAVDVVLALRAAGFEALFAGGCVRDRLLGRGRAKDFDVATNATPEQIRQVFRHRRTLSIGQAFGVITVLGPRGAGQVEVATFRRDAGYSDGRHPDGVTFCGAEEDARRRDFTINGMFYDPVADRVIDYVGGQEDLRRGLIRAIGDPYARIAEDKLRMLRAVRFAARFAFAVDPATLIAIQRQAPDLRVVSAERISAELRMMLIGEHRARAIELLHESRLLPVVFPEYQGVAPDGERNEDAWQTTLAILRSLETDRFPIAFAAFVRPCLLGRPTLPHDLRGIAERLRLTNAERKETEFLLLHEPLVRTARQVPWPRLQRVLIQDSSDHLLTYAQAVAATVDGSLSHIEFCREKLRLPPEALNPPPLLTGADLLQLGWPPGPAFQPVLDAVRDAQLDRHIHTKPEALALAQRLR